MTDTAERKLFKDWFDRAAARRLASQVGAASRGFDEQKFVRLASQRLATLEFGARVRQFSDALKSTLPADVPHALRLLSDSLPAPLVDCEAVSDGWLQWPIGQFISDHGLDHFDESMTAMIELTQRFSSEFAVRPFVDRFPHQTFARMLELTSHPSPHVRRWCSEGTRPRLPWGRKLRGLVADPNPIWPIVEELKDDRELYVRRSVANNLNDIAKDHPDQVVAKCQQWMSETNEDRAWVVRHALRSLIKDGHPGALAVIGFGPPRRISASLTVRPRRVVVGDEIELTASLHSTAARSQDLIVDYVVHFVRQRDKTSAKVFKWSTYQLAARGEAELTKRHRIKTTTIRALYPGVHRIELQVNGVCVAEASFRLVEPA